MATPSAGKGVTMTVCCVHMAADGARLTGVRGIDRDDLGTVPTGLVAQQVHETPMGAFQEAPVEARFLAHVRAGVGNRACC